MNIVLEYVQYSDQLFNFTPAETMRLIRKQSGLIWHSTALALKGAPISKILAAGKRKSNAFLMYIDEDTIDAAEFFNTTLDIFDNAGGD